MLQVPNFVKSDLVFNERLTEFSVDIYNQGNTCTEAIYRYIKDKNIDTCGCTGENSNGNGSLMRILPACIFLALDNPDLFCYQLLHYGKDKKTTLSTYME